MKGALAVLSCCMLWACGRAPETAVDPQLAREVAQIKVIDHHAHPVLPTSAGEAPDTDYDALPVESLAPQSNPTRMRTDYPVIVEVHRLFSEKRIDPVALLDQLGIESMFANRVTMGRGLPSPRFLWVPFDDALMYPLSNASLIHNSDQQAFFEDEERLLKRYYVDLHVAA